MRIWNFGWFHSGQIQKLFASDGLLKMSESLVSNKEIAKINDQLRTNLICKVYLTRSVAYSNHREQILNAVKEFNEFNRGNDPYGEHDFGSFELSGIKYFWKFDYYDNNYEFFQHNGNRVLTIGQLNEY